METTKQKEKLLLWSFLFSVSCPPEWIKDNELCFLYKGSSFSFVEAKTYCQVGKPSRVNETTERKGWWMHPSTKFFFFLIFETMVYSKGLNLSVPVSSFVAEVWICPLYFYDS